jgi:hypothetical protein
MSDQSIEGKLQVIGELSVGATAEFSGDAYVRQNLQVSGAGYVHGGLSVSGLTQLENGQIGSQGGDLRLATNGNTRLTIQQDSGWVGVGTTNPQSTLHVLSSGNRWNLSDNEGDFKIGNDQVRLKMSISTSGAGTGHARIRAHGGNDTLLLGSGTEDVLAVQGHRVGINTREPKDHLHVVGNVLVDDSGKGIQLSAADRPMITRGFDRFESGKYDGIGRWGVFMEPSAMTFGIPRRAGKKFVFKAFGDNSEGVVLLQLDADGTLRYRQLAAMSSRTIKEDIVSLSHAEAVELFRGLRPVKFQYKELNGSRPNLGFVAEDAPLPVTTADGQAIDLTSVVAILCQVVHDQQEELDGLRRRISDQAAAAG